MPIYSMSAPDGKTYQIEGPPGATDAQIRAQIIRQFPHLGGGPISGDIPGDRPKAGFTGAYKEAFQTLRQADESAAWAIAQKRAEADPTPENLATAQEARKALLAAGESPYETTRFTGLKDFDLGQNIQALKEVAGGSAGFLTAPAIAAGAGFFAGGIGAPIAGYGTLAAQYGVSNLQLQAQEMQRAIDAGETPREVSLAKAATGAAFNTALDRLSFGIYGQVLKRLPILDKTLGHLAGKEGGTLGRYFKETAEDGTLRPTKGRIWRGVAKGVAFEVPQEVAQQAADRWQAGLSLTNDEAQEEFRQAAIGAFLLGGSFGAVGGGMAGLPSPPPTNAQLRAEIVSIAGEGGLSDAQMSAVIERAYETQKDYGKDLTREELQEIIVAEQLKEGEIEETTDKIVAERAEGEPRTQAEAKGIPAEETPAERAAERAERNIFAQTWRTYSELLNKAEGSLPEGIPLKDVTRDTLVQELIDEDIRRTNAGEQRLTTNDVIKIITIEAKPEVARQKLTPDAVALLKSVDAGDIPAYITNNIEKIARANGIIPTKDTAPEDIIAALQAIRDTSPQEGESYSALAEGDLSGLFDPAVEDRNVKAIEEEINKQETEVYGAALGESKKYGSELSPAFLRGVRTALQMEAGLTRAEGVSLAEEAPSGIITRPATVEKGEVVLGEAQVSTATVEAAERAGRTFALAQVNREAPPPVETAPEFLARYEAGVSERKDFNRRAGNILALYTRIPGGRNKAPAIRMALAKALRSDPNLDQNINEWAAAKEVGAGSPVPENVRRIVKGAIAKENIATDPRFAAPAAVKIDPGKTYTAEERARYEADEAKTEGIGTRGKITARVDSAKKRAAQARGIPSGAQVATGPALSPREVLERKAAQPDLVGRPTTPQEGEAGPLFDTRFEFDAVPADAPAETFDADNLIIAENIPSDTAGVIRGWKQQWLPNAKVRVSTAPRERLDGELGRATHIGGGVYEVVFASDIKSQAQLEVFGHEMGHVLMMSSYRNAPQETKDAIQADYENWKKKNPGKSFRAPAMAELTGDTVPIEYLQSFEEYFADSVARWAVSAKEPQSVVEKFFSSIVKTLRAFYKTLRGQKFLPTETFSKYMDEVTRKVKVGGTLDTTEPIGLEGETYAAAGVRPNVARGLENVQRSKRTSLGFIASFVELARLKGVWAALRTYKNTLKQGGTTQLIAPTLPTYDIVRWIGTRLKVPRIINNMINQMAAWRGKRLTELEAREREIQTFINENPEVADKLVDTQFLTTLTQIDPENLGRQPAGMSKADFEGYKVEIKQFWESLGEKGRGLYRSIRADYQKDFKSLNELARKRIVDSKILSQEEKTELTTKLRDFIEQAEQLRVYFPLSRFGDFWFSIGESGTIGHEFSMYTTRRERDQQKAIREEETGMPAEEGNIKDSTAGINDQLGQDKLVSDLLNALTKEGQEVSEIADHVRTLWLRTLPLNDARRRYEKRKGTTGYSTDLMQVYSHSRRNSINLRSRFKFSEGLRNQVSSLGPEIEGRPAAERAQLKSLTNEIAYRVNRELAPDNFSGWDKFAGGINQAVFYYMLSSVRSALVQLTQVPVVAAPYFMARYRISAPQAMKLLFATRRSGKLLYDDTNVEGLFANEKDPNMRRAMQNVYEEIKATRELESATFHSDIRGYATGTGPSATSLGAVRRLSRVKEQVLNVMGWGFQKTESGSRKMVFAAAMELELKRKLPGLIKKKAKELKKDNQTLTEERALEMATEEVLARREITNKEGDIVEDVVLSEELQGILDESRQVVRDSLFDYTNFNKSSLMTFHPISRVATQFMTFPLQMTSYLIRNFATLYNSKKDRTERAAAAKMFFGTTIMAGVFSGTKGLPFYGMITGLLDAFADEYDIDDDDDPTNPMVMRDSDLWFREYWIPQHFGPDSDFAKTFGLEPARLTGLSITSGPVSALTGWDIGPSVSLNLSEMWFHNRGNTSASARDAIKETAYNRLSGPGGAMLQQIATGTDDIQNGHILRGAEKLVPAFLRGLIKTGRVAIEGEATRTGAVIRDETWYTTAKLLGLTAGFQSTEVSDIYDSTFGFRAIAAEIVEDRAKVYQKLDRAFREDNDSKIDAALEDVFDFNRRNWFVPITSARLLASLKGRAQTRAEAILGLTLEQSLEHWAYDIFLDDFQDYGSGLFADDS